MDWHRICRLVSHIMRIIKIKGTNLELTSQVRDYLQQRLEDIDKFLANVGGTQEAEIELAKTTDHHQQGRIYKAEIMISLKGELLRAESKKENIYQAIDDVKDDITREIKKYKEKKSTQSRKKARLFKKIMRISPLARWRDKK